MKRLLPLVLAVAATPAWALEFASTDQAAILYDAPASQANKVAVVSAGYPLEVLVRLQDWVKVRDATGAIEWIAAGALGAQPTVMVNVPQATIHAQPGGASPALFQANQGVAFPLLGQSGGWAQVKLPNGATGYLRLGALWGV